jgi:nitrous oxidase accessory protein
VALKDSDNMTLRGNVIAGNRTGLYFDNSPGRPDAYNTVSGNTIAYNDVGMAFMPSVKRNRIGGNGFVENWQQVAVLAGGSFDGNDWTPGGKGNYWSDYAGYDADRDGVGDLPHAHVSLFYDLLRRHEELRILALSPAQAALDLAARTFPVFQPDASLVDEAPLVDAPRPLHVPQARHHQGGLAPLAGALVAGALAVAAWAAAMDHPPLGPSDAWRRAAAEASR